MALLHLAITAFDLPPLGPERRRRYARLAVLGGYHGPLGGKRTPLCYSPATSLAQMQQPLHRPCAPGQPRHRPQLPVRRKRPRAAQPQPLTGWPARHRRRSTVSWWRSTRISRSPAASRWRQASSWMKRHLRSANLDGTRWPLSLGGSVTVPNRVSMRTRSSQATSESPHPTGSSAGCHRREKVERCHRRCAWPGDGRRLTRPTLLRSEGPRGGSLSSCGTALFATCRWRGWWRPGRRWCPRGR